MSEPKAKKIINKAKRKIAPSNGESKQTVEVSEQSLNTVAVSPTLSKATDVVEDVFGKNISKKVRSKSFFERKKSLLKELGLKEVPKDLQRLASRKITSQMSINTWEPDESSCNILDKDKFLNSLKGPEESYLNIPGSSHFKDANQEFEFRDVIHPTYNPPLGSYDYYRIYDRYLALLDQFEKYNRTQQRQGLIHIWQQKIKLELLSRFRWPPKIMSDVFWSYGYYRDYCPREARVNLKISKRIRKSLEKLLIGYHSHHQHHYRHRLNSGYDFATHIKGDKRNSAEMHLLDEEWLKAHPDIQAPSKPSSRKQGKRTGTEEHRHHHHTKTNYFDQEDNQIGEMPGLDLRGMTNDTSINQVSPYDKVEEWLQETNVRKPGPRTSTLKLNFKKSSKTSLVIPSVERQSIKDTTRSRRKIKKSLNIQKIEKPSSNIFQSSTPSPTSSLGSFTLDGTEKAETILTETTAKPKLAKKRNTTKKINVIDKIERKVSNAQDGDISEIQGVKPAKKKPMGKKQFRQRISSLKESEILQSKEGSD